MTTQKVRRVKAWAIVQKRDGIIENADYFAANDCPAAEMTNAGAVYLSLQDAHSMLIPDEHRIVPCTITYSLPPKKIR